MIQVRWALVRQDLVSVWAFTGILLLGIKSTSSPLLLLAWICSSSIILFALFWATISVVKSLISYGFSISSAKLFRSVLGSTKGENWDSELIDSVVDYYEKTLNIRWTKLSYKIETVGLSLPFYWLQSKSEIESLLYSPSQVLGVVTIWRLASNSLFICSPSQVFGVATNWR